MLWANERYKHWNSQILLKKVPHLNSLPRREIWERKVLCEIPNDSGSNCAFLSVASSFK
jgi:hypothetical protein